MKFFHRLRTHFRKQELDQELSEELAFHIEQETEENIAAGMSAEEARYAALRKFGGVEQVKEECRDAWGVRFIETLLQDLCFGVRMLAKSPGFTVVAVIMLALGVGVTTTIFTAANDFLLRPLPFSNSDRLVMVNRYLREFAQSGTNDPPTFKFWREQNHVFEDMAAWSVMTDHFNLTGAEGPVRVPAKQVSTGFFHVLGVKPI